MRSFHSYIDGRVIVNSRIEDFVSSLGDVRTFAVRAFTAIAIEAENLEAGRELIPFQPLVEGVPTTHDFAVRRSAAVHMIHRQHLDSVFAAALTYAAVLV